MDEHERDCDAARDNKAGKEEGEVKFPPVFVVFFVFVTAFAMTHDIIIRARCGKFKKPLVVFV